MPASLTYSVLLIIRGGYGSQPEYITCSRHNLPVFVVEFIRLVYDREDHLARDLMLSVQIEPCENGNTGFAHFVRSGSCVGSFIDRFDECSNAIGMRSRQPSQCMKCALQNSPASLVASSMLQNIPHKVGHCVIETSYIT